MFDSTVTRLWTFHININCSPYYNLGKIKIGDLHNVATIGLQSYTDTTKVGQVTVYDGGSDVTKVPTHTFTYMMKLKHTDSSSVVTDFLITEATISYTNTCESSSFS